MNLMCSTQKDLSLYNGAIFFNKYGLTSERLSMMEAGPSLKRILQLAMTAIVRVRMKIQTLMSHKKSKLQEVLQTIQMTLEAVNLKMKNLSRKAQMLRLPATTKGKTGIKWSVTRQQKKMLRGMPTLRLVDKLRPQIEVPESCNPTPTPRCSKFKSSNLLSAIV